MSNRIPRNATKLDVTFKIETFAKTKHMVASKDRYYGWIGMTDEGRRYSLFASMLRNSEICTIKVIETQEERKIYKVTAYDPWARRDAIHICTYHYDSKERAEQKYNELLNYNKNWDVILKDVTENYNEGKILPGWVNWSN